MSAPGRSFLMLLTALSLLCVFLGTGCKHKILAQGRSLPANYAILLFDAEMEACPEAIPNLPPRHAAGGAAVEAGYFDGPYCHGFTKYSLNRSEDPALAPVSRETVPVYARIAHGQPCRLWVAVPSRRQDDDAGTANLAALFAGTAFPPTGAKPRLPPRTSNAFETREAFASWCEQRLRKPFLKDRKK